MIVFDEVHRVKGISGQRAKAALLLGKSSKYHYVLTGTPIPNSYMDIYNLLHISILIYIFAPSKETRRIN